VAVALTNVEGTPTELVSVRVASEAFKVEPPNPRLLPLENGSSALFIISPLGKGNKKVYVAARYLGPLPPGVLSAGKELEPQHEVEEIVDVPVIGRPGNIFSLLQVASVALGLPSVVLLILNRFLAHRKATNADKARTIIP